MVKRDKFQVILEKCTEQLQKGGSLEECLSQYPEHRERLEPLLRLALRISAIEKAKPSDEFVDTSKARILSKIQQSAAESDTAQRKSRAFTDYIADMIKDAFRPPVSLRKYALPVGIVAVLAIILSVGQMFYFRPSAVLAAPCTLNVFTGNVEVQMPGTDEWLAGANRMVLEEGTSIRTQDSSHAILTFYAGSTSIKLEPSTEIIVQQLNGDEEEKNITVMQITGKTWSFVSPSESGGTVYRVDTPSASAIAQGTLFTVEIDNEGSTTIATTEGKVKVKAQDSEVIVASLQKVKVKSGEEPPEPVAVTPPLTEITISANKGIAASITDPNGSSTGVLEDGFTYNQITGSQSVLYSDGPQVITIPEPENGEYVLILSCDAPGSTKLNVLISSDDKEVYKFRVTLPASEQNLWLIHLDVSVEDGAVTDASVHDVESLNVENVDNIVTVSPTVEEQEKAKSQSDKKKDSEDKENKGKKKDDGDVETETEEEKDNRGQDKQDEDKGNQGQGQQDEDKGNKGQDKKDEDKGNQGQDKQDEDKDNKGQEKKDEDNANTPGNSGSESEDKNNKGQDKKDNKEDKDNKGNNNSGENESNNQKDKDKTNK